RRRRRNDARPPRRQCPTTARSGTGRVRRATAAELYLTLAVDGSGVAAPGHYPPAAATGCYPPPLPAGRGIARRLRSPGGLFATDDLLHPGRHELRGSAGTHVVEHGGAATGIEVELNRARSGSTGLDDEARRGIDLARSADGGKHIAVVEAPHDLLHLVRH